MPLPILQRISFLLPLCAAAACADTSDDGNDSAADDGSGEGPTDASGEGEVDDGGTGADGESADTGADPSTVDACRAECDFELEFDCIDTAEHEDCWTTCGTASAADIDLFLACTDASPLCGEDPAGRRECLANFLDVAPDPTGAETGTEGPSCVEACNDYLATPCDPPVEGATSCEDFCGMFGADVQAVIVECLTNAVGCTLPADCQIPDA